MFRLMSLIALLSLGLSVSAGDVYNVDAGHSSVLFKVSHQTVGMQWGRFNEFDGKVTFDGDAVAGAEFTLEVASIDTNSAKRDGHLRKADFFSANEFPQVTFKSTKVEKTDKGFAVTGDLTMVGVTKSVTFNVISKGPVDGRNGAKIRGVHGSTTIKRSDFNMTYGIPGIGDEVTIKVSLEVVKK